MGISLRDIHEQRDMLRRGEEIARAAKQAADRESERMRLRDQFAAAALTGLVSYNRDNDSPCLSSDFARWAYHIADHMLKARDATGHQE